jgi:hypothetical protein
MKNSGQLSSFFMMMMIFGFRVSATSSTTTTKGTLSSHPPAAAMITNKMFPDLAKKRRMMQQQQHEEEEEERKLQLSSSLGTCNTDREVSRGPNALLTALTDPSIYDKTKRPSISYHPSRDISTNPDYVFTRLVINSIVSLNELTQSLTTRLGFLKYSHDTVIDFSLYPIPSLHIVYMSKSQFAYINLFHNIRNIHLIHDA